jgi:hypothetical protein
MKEKVQRFIDNIGGNFVEISYRDALYQCMDLAYAWVFVLDIPKSTIQQSHAYKVWDQPRAITREYFDLLENTPSFVPTAGDVAVFRKSINGTAGHIAIVADNNSDVNGMNVFEQNFPLGANPRIRRTNYNHVAGFLRPKTQVVPQPEPIIEDDTVIPQIIDDNGNAMQVHAIRSTINDTKRDLKSCQDSTQARINEEVEKERAKQLADCNNRVETAKNEVKTQYEGKLAEHKTECQEEIKNLKLELEKMVRKKAKDLPASTLFVFAIKNLLKFKKGGE